MRILIVGDTVSRQVHIKVAKSSRADTRTESDSSWLAETKSPGLEYATHSVEKQWLRKQLKISARTLARRLKGESKPEIRHLKVDVRKIKPCLADLPDEVAARLRSCHYQP